MAKTVVLLGDSLTEWNDWQRAFPDMDVANLGIAGETVEGLRSRVGPAVSRYPKADYVFIMSGINNMAMGYRDFLPAYREIVRVVNRTCPQARVTVQSILPTLGDWVAPADVVEMNRALEMIAEEEKVFFLDVHRAFVDAAGRARPDLLEPDGVHVSQAGYRVWEDLLKPLLVP